MMKQKKLGKKIGIWMDKRQAKFFSIDDENDSILSVKSNIEEFHPKGGSGTRFKGGPQEVVHDSKYLKREKQQLKLYFEQLISKLSKDDSVVVFGPGVTANKFGELVKNKHPEFNKVIIGLEKTDSMTDNQIKAWIRKFFKSK